MKCSRQKSQHQLAKQSFIKITKSSRKKKLQLLRNFIKQVNRHSYVCDQKLRYCIKHLHDTPSKKSRHWKNYLKHNLFFYCIISNAVKIPRVIKKKYTFSQHFNWKLTCILIGLGTELNSIWSYLAINLIGVLNRA